MSLLPKSKLYWQRFSGIEKILLLVFVVFIFIGTVLWRIDVNKNSNQVPAQGGEYTEGLVGQPRHINPALAPANDVDLDITKIIYSGLYKFDPQMNLIPDLAASLPEITENGTIYTITLKENLFWHDGAMLTADDVVYTFQAIQNPELQSPLRISWNKVEIIKIDNKTIQLKLKDASAPFVANLTVGIMPKHIWENVPANTMSLSQFNLQPVGSGPYRLTEIKRRKNGEIQTITLKPHKQYHNGEPYIETIIFKFYESADKLIDAYQGRDIMGLGYVPFDRNLFIQPKDDLQNYTLLLPQYQAIFINRLKNPAALDDQNVRMALAKSVDKKKIIDEVYSGQATEAYGPILPGHLGYHEQIPGAEMNIYDVEAAKNLLEKSEWQMDETVGFRKDKEGRIITLSIATNNFPPNVRVAELLKEMWQAVGIQIILNIETVANLEEQYIRPRNYELLLFSENVGPDPDPYPFWHSSQIRDPGLNLTNFNNPQADQFLVKARGNISPEIRAENYQKFQEILVGDIPAIFLARNVYVYNVDSEIKGIDLNTIVTQAARFNGINKWYIKTRKQ